MVDYDFSVLSDKEFEILAADLLTKEIGKRIDRFKPGRDKGVDGRYFSSPDEEVVIQCKHYTSGFNALENSLKKKKNGISEVDKVHRLKPSRYILVTSAPLSRVNKQKILTLFQPFMKNEEDIYGRENLNDLLKLYPDVEKRFYKLWLSSSTILETILHNNVHGRSRFCVEEIQEKTKIFVQTPSFDSAMRILQETRVLVLEGEPGIGKTTLAEALSYHFVAQEYDFIFVDREIADIEDVITPDRKQIFYFDDFLGHNYLDILRNNSESTIVNVIRRIRHSGNKYLILTTRTNILSQAKLKYDIFTNNKIEIHEHILTMQSYSRNDKARILYNHMYFSRLPDDYLNEIFLDKRYLHIIDHKNYNPRLVEHMCDPNRATRIEPKAYWSNIAKSLDNPQAIWRSAYENQLNEEARFILETMFSFGDQAPENLLKQAFADRITYETSTNNHQTSPNPFFNGVKSLLDIFLKRFMTGEGTAHYTFFNPSIADFLLNYLMENEHRRWQILESARFIQQMNTRFTFVEDGKIKLSNDEKNHFISIITQNFGRWLSIKDSNPELEAMVVLQNADREKTVDLLKNGKIGLDLTQIPRPQDKFRDYMNYLEICILAGRFHGMERSMDLLLDRLFDLSGDLKDLERVLNFFRHDQIIPLLTEEQQKKVGVQALNFIKNKADNLATENYDISGALNVEEMDKAASKFHGELEEFFLLNDLPTEEIDDIIEYIDFDNILYYNKQNADDDRYEDYKSSSSRYIIENTIEDMFVDWRD